MLAVNCPSCGGPTPVSLAAPDTISCVHCGRSGPAPQQVAAELSKAAAVLEGVDAGRRQLSSLQRSIIRSRAIGCLHFALIFLLTLPLLLNTALCTIDKDTTAWLALASLLPVFAMIASGVAGTIWIRRQRSKLLRACTAVPPQGPGHAARCRVCGAPIETEPDDTVARCSFCHSDNIVDSVAIGGMASRQQVVLGAYEQNVLLSAAAIAPSTTFSKVAAIVMAVVVPFVTILLSVGVGLSLQRIHVAPNAEHTYAAWPTGDGRCLGRIHHEEGKNKLNFGQTKLRDVKDEITVPGATKLDVHHAPDLVGKKVFLRGTVGTISEAYRALGSKTNSVAIDLSGGNVTASIAGLCLAEPPYPKELAAVPEVGSKHLVLDEKRMFWTHGGSVLSVPVAGGTPEPLVQRDGFIEVLAADATHLFVVEAGAISSIAKATGEVKKLAGTPNLTAARDMCLDDTHVYYVVGDKVWRIPKVGGARPKDLATAQDAFGLVTHEGRLYFHSAKKGSILSVPVGGGATITVANGQKLEPNLPLFIVGDKVSFVSTSKQLLEVPTSGGKPKRVAGLGEKPDGYLRRGNDVFYWVQASAAGEGGGIFHMLVGRAGKPRNLAPTVAEVSGFTVGGPWAYWLDGVNLRLMRVEPPATGPGPIRLPSPGFTLPKPGKGKGKKVPPAVRPPSSK